jgi:glucose-1-phosphate thymidylyltransferase
MRGIILAGGSGTRLYPLTKATSKQMVPIYDKPMIYYPLSVLMLAGIREVLIISTERDLPGFKELLGDGSDLGMNFQYLTQYAPNGLAEAFIIGEHFIGEDEVAMVLGDNIFWGHGFTDQLRIAGSLKDGACVFGYYVQEPKAYGVVEFDKAGNVLSIEEKPEQPKSNYAIPGLYFYDNTVIKKAKSLEMSSRGEYEITDLNRLYLEDGNLKVTLLGRGMAWLDTGTHDSMLDASNFVAAVQKRQGTYIACIEEIAYRNGWINNEKMMKLAQPLLKTQYGQYIMGLLQDWNEKPYIAASQDIIGS